MQIKKTIEVTLSKKDIEKIIIEHLKTKGYQTDSVYFRIGVEYDPSDFDDRYGGTDVLKEATCIVTENKK